MNLERFHLLFIACASALAFLFGAWAIRASALAGGARVATAGVAFGVGVALIAYEGWFVRYLRRP